MDIFHLDSTASLSWQLPVGVGILIALCLFRDTQHKIRLPGPRGYPIFGNLLQLGEDHAQTYFAWSKLYGAVYRVTLGEREVVVVNSAAAAKELFNDLGSIYISRPLFHAFHNVVSSTAGFTIGSSPWDDSCKRKRRAAATALNRPAVQSYVPIMDRETLSLVEDIYRDSDRGAREINPYAYLQRFALNISLVVNYGSRLESVGDAMLREIIEVETYVANFRSVSGQMSDYVPALRYLPSLETNNARHGADVRARRDRYMHALLQDLQGRMEKGTDIPCITGNILRDPDAKLDDLELSSICLSMVSAGLDTLANTFIWSVGYLAKHPEIQEKAYQAMYDVYQEEIPDSSEEKVEYITALHKECSRYFTVLKLALPRATLGDSSYRGVHIPSGTTVFLNAWAIHHDAQRYGLDHDTFRPERFLDPSEASQQSHYSFGAGRRMCAGVHLANRELYIAFCKLIHFFKIVPGEDAYDIDPATACANPKGLSSTPKPFKVTFLPRNEAAIQGWIDDEKAKAEHKMAASVSSKLSRVGAD
jgi:phenylacetate 2-hydroxylase